MFLLEPLPFACKGFLCDFQGPLEVVSKRITFLRFIKGALRRVYGLLPSWMQLFIRSPPCFRLDPAKKRVERVRIVVLAFPCRLAQRLRNLGPSGRSLPVVASKSTPSIYIL